MPSPLHGQATANGLSTAVPVSSTAVSCTAFTIKAPLSNNQPVYLGSSTVTSTSGYQLDPGDEFQYEKVSQLGQPRYELNPSDFYFAGTSPDKVTWLASP